MLTRKAKFVIVLIILICAATIPSALIVSMNFGHVQLASIIKSNRTFAFVGEDIQFRGDSSTGKIKSYNWDFQDGNSSIEKNPSHAFETSGWYNVSLMVTDTNDKKASAELVIGIQHENISQGFEMARDKYFRPGAITVFQDVEIGPNIKNPSINASLSITNGAGLFTVYFAVYDSITNETILYTEDLALKGENRNISRSFDSDDIPKQYSLSSSHFQIGIQIQKGGYSGASNWMDISYSLTDCIAPPLKGS